MGSRRPLVLLLLVTALLLLAGRAIASLYVEQAWFAAIDAEEVWRLQTLTALTVHGASWLAGTLFVFANLHAVRSSVVSLVLPRRVANIEIGEEVPGRYLTFAVAALSVLLGALLTVTYADWTTAYQALFGAPFHDADPYFNLDLGFFVYWLPFERALFLWALIAVLLVSAVVVFLYALTPSLRWERGTLHSSIYVRRHLSVLACLLLLVAAWKFRLDAFRILGDGSSGDGAFGYVDHRLGIPASAILSGIAISAAVLVLWTGWMGQVRVAIGGVIAVVVLSLGLRQLAPVLVRRFAEPEDPRERERPYVAARAIYTRLAFGAGRITRAAPAMAPLDAAALAGVVPVWDEPALVRAVERTRRTTAINGAVSWVRDTDGLVAMVPGRTGSENDVATGVTWTVSRILASRTDERGALVGGDGAIAAADQDIALEPVLVHDSALAYLIISDPRRRVPAPTLERLRSRLAHAWSLQNVRLLVGDLPHPRPSILRRRDVHERVRAIAPFFALGSAAAPIVLRDSLLWVVDLYSSSATFPLSARLQAAGEERAYFLHAARAIVNGASGRVVLVADSVLDPIARTWVTRFPGLFITVSELPTELRDRLPVAADGARARATAFAAFGSRTEGMVGRELAWTNGADDPLAGPAESILAFSDDAVPARALPVLGEGGAITGLLVERGGALPTSVWFPLPRPTLRWATLVERLRAVVDSGAVATAREGNVVRGAVRAVPLRSGVALVQTSYAWRAQGAPTVHRVAVLAGDSLRVGATLADALGAPTAPADATALPADERLRVRILYDSMRVAMRRGDWTAFGAAYEALGRLLGRPPR